MTKCSIFRRAPSQGAKSRKWLDVRLRSSAMASAVLIKTSDQDVTRKHAYESDYDKPRCVSPLLMICHTKHALSYFGVKFTFATLILSDTD